MSIFARTFATCGLAALILLTACTSAETRRAATDDYYNVSYWSGGAQFAGNPRIVINLREQRAYAYRGDILIGSSLVSTGREGFATREGQFRIQSKTRHHRSSLYGNYVDANDNVVVANVDSRKQSPPPGSHYKGASMPYFMRFDGGIGMHAGFLPGYAASHGCVRMPEDMAEKFYQTVKVGTPVTVVK